MNHPFEMLGYHSADGVARITFQRAPYNVLNIALLKELERALSLAAADDSLRLLLLTGSGEKFFSAGVDVQEHTADYVAAMLSSFHAVIRAVWNFPLPTLAVLNGSAFGGGCELALACDLALAVAGAQLGQPEIRLGVFAPVAAILLPQRLPAVRAHELLLAGQPLSAEEAYQLGLLNRIFAPADFVAGVHAFIQPYLQLSRAAQLQNKQALRAASGLSFDAALTKLEQQYLQELMQTADAQEGVQAFLEKRLPQWRHQ